MLQGSQYFYEFGGYRLDPAERLLLRHGEPVELPPKSFDTLLVLVKNSGRLVSKDQLLELVWPNTAVEEGNLTLAVHHLRKALSSGSNGAQYIETVPRHGYRFKAEVAKYGEEEAVPPSAAQEDFRVPFDNATTSSQPSWALIVTAVAVLGLAVSVLAFRSRTSLAKENRSIAILPFLNLTPEPTNQYLSDGISEELTTRLAQLPELKVAARTSAFQFEGKPRDVREIGRQLNVDAILEGSVTRANEGPSGDQLRVTAQLISVRDGYHLWSSSYSGPPSQLFEIQENIVRQVAKALNTPLSAVQESRLTHRETTNPDAHDLYLEARYLWNQRSRGSKLEQSIALFQRAIDKDPKYALAYAGLADAYAVMAVNNSSATVAPAVKMAASSALALDSSLSEPHAALGLIESQVEWKFADAEREFQQALMLDPNNAAAHHWRGLNLTILGRFNDAEAEFRKAQVLDPNALMITDGLAENFFYEGRLDDAIAQGQHMLQVDPGMPAALIILSYSYFAKKTYADCLRTAEQLTDEPGLTEIKRLLIAEVDAVSGKQRQGRETAQQLEKTSLGRSRLATLYAILNDRDHALALLQEAYQLHEPNLVFLKLDPRYDNLHGDPRYQALLRKVGLPE